MSFPPLQLIKRLDKGSKITPAEEDQNMTDIETAVNGFFAELSVALNPDGTLKVGSVSTNAIQDRAVTLQKLAFLSSFYAVDTGGANAIAISFTPGLTAYVAGLVFFVKAAATNTGATTLNVNLVGNAPVKTFIGPTLSDLTAAQIIVGNIYLMVHDGTQFLLINPTSTTPLSDVYASSGDTSIAVTDIDLSFVLPAGAQTWTKIEMFSQVLIDSDASSLATATTTLKWNCGALLNSAVVVSPTTGAGNSGQVSGVNGDNQTYALTAFSGVIPTSINAIPTLIIRASLLMAGAFNPASTWRFWARASCQ